MTIIEQWTCETIEFYLKGNETYKKDFENYYKEQLKEEPTEEYYKLVLDCVNFYKTNLIEIELFKNNFRKADKRTQRKLVKGLGKFDIVKQIVYKGVIKNG